VLNCDSRLSDHDWRFRLSSCECDSWINSSVSVSTEEWLIQMIFLDVWTILEPIEISWRWPTESVAPLFPWHYKSKRAWQIDRINRFACQICGIHTCSRVMSGLRVCECYENESVWSTTRCALRRFQVQNPLSASVCVNGSLIDFRKTRDQIDNGGFACTC